jgi:ATP-dependent DNA ligase
MRQSLENDGYRALLGRWPGGRVLIRSRNGGNVTAGFPEIVAAASRSLGVL